MEIDRELQELLDKLDVPVSRRNDMRWLSRNLMFANQNHQDADRALELVKIKLTAEIRGGLSGR